MNVFLTQCKIVKEKHNNVFFVFNDTLLVFYILTLSLTLVLFDPPVSFNFGRYLQHKIRQIQKDWRY